MLRFALTHNHTLCSSFYLLEFGKWQKSEHGGTAYGGGGTVFVERRSDDEEEKTSSSQWLKGTSNLSNSHVFIALRSTAVTSSFILGLYYLPRTVQIDSSWPKSKMTFRFETSQAELGFIWKCDWSVWKNLKMCETEMKLCRKASLQMKRT